MKYYKNLFTADFTREWTQQEPDDHLQAPIFLVGFPRSGTTLLDTVLRSHPRVTVLEEAPLVEPVLFHDSGGGEERALEGDALHAQLEIGVRGLVAGDLERIQVEEADLLVQDDLLEGLRDVLPDLKRWFQR